MMTKQWWLDVEYNILLYYFCNNGVSECIERRNLILKYEFDQSEKKEKWLGYYDEKVSNENLGRPNFSTRQNYNQN